MSLDPLYKGTKPPCVSCGVLLKPKYDTESEHQLRYTWHDEEPAGYNWEWVEEKNQYRKEKWVHAVVKRKFTGHFGYKGSDAFCSKTCAVQWAIAHAAQCAPKGS
jgi:hypothetical protein